MESYPRARLHGMRWVLVEASGPGPPRDRCGPRRVRAARASRSRYRHSPRDDARGGERQIARDSQAVRRSPPGPWSGPPASTPQPEFARLNLPLDERGRVPVDDHLRVKGMDAVWAIGDCAAAPDPRGGTYPPTAQHAVRQGPVGGSQHRCRAGGRLARPFEYRGNAAFVNLGRYKAVGRIGSRTFRGFPAWWLARSYHMSQIPGAARKAHAVIDWTTSLPFRRDLAELGSIGHPERLDGTMSAWDSSTRSSRSSSAWRRAIVGTRQGQLLLDLASDRGGAADPRPDRGHPLPLREGGTRTPVPDLPQGGEALRPGLPALRHRPLPSRPRRGPPPRRQVGATPAA